MARLIALRSVLLLVVVVLVARLAQLQLVQTEAQRFGADIEVTTRRYLTNQPRRGEIVDARGVLLAESVPIYNLAVVPGQLPPASRAPEQRAVTLARLAQIAELPATLIIDPASAIETTPGLRAELAALAEMPSLDTTEVLTLTIAPPDTLRALAISQTYREVVKLVNPVEQLLQQANARSYQPVVIKEDISPELVLALRENANYLPGARVIEGFRRRYPLSNTIPSLSHLLGYVGRINACELVAVNPASSWLRGLVDITANAPICGLMAKQIDPASVGLPPYLPSDQIGKDGLEGAYESVLRGQMGIDSLLVDALQRPVSDVTTLRPVVNGHDLVLTIDAQFQAEVERILQRWINEGEQRRQTAREVHKRAYDPIVAGVAVALDPRTGRVLAMVSLPDYDNNIWVDPARANELRALLAPPSAEAQRELQRLAPFTNRAIAGQYPPGSTLKQFVGAVALQQGVIAADTKLRDPGLLRLIERSGAEFILPNSVRNRDNGQIDVRDALRLSSNVFFASVAGGNDQATNLDQRALRITGLGIDQLVEGLSWFNFGRATGIDLVGEASGRVPTRAWKAQVLREAWTTGDTYNTAIGQGYLEVTPLQLAVAAGAVATDGTLYRPHLVDRIVDENGQLVQQIQPEPIGKAPIDPQHLATIRQGLLASITDGLGIAAREACSGLRIAGKTGTAEFGPLLTTADGRLVRQSHAWFVGFAPYENPEIVVAVLVEGVGDLNDGSSTIALPAVTQIMQAYFGVTPPANRPSICPVLPGESNE
ncbi:penicillin-binding transpeptidase domain-containing protein [Chloroflexus sp.]|uniref:penicillin-binding transpeptidase domain-containing protein n=1 Tax=Chloroflexus sp. TaxID=1904827 RepID=UPI00298EDE67|nr:penicillin-binding transpeptidase domain-containing protein [Chloroflexus sp.]MCX7858586.1 penicillin-binding transpeptidase domain-containing protein [Chloroflexus sp.]MDW8405170.1 penicillin-binding transpeptidase domain-containing protein [Chloroflexus sp.]